MKKINFSLFAVLIFLLAACSHEKGSVSLKQPKNGGVYVVAHRGAHQGIPENSLAAYQKAINLGVDFIEIDIRTTRDGKFVSIHNNRIDAYVAEESGAVEDFTLSELKQMDIGKRIGPEWEGTRIPTFEEILDLCKGKCGVYLDLKDAAVEPLIKMIKERGMAHEVLWYADTYELQDVSKMCPECIIMPDPGAEKNLPELIGELNPKVIAAVWKHFSKSFVETCHQAGALVLVDESGKDCWQEALKWGADGIQTDYPAELIEFLTKNVSK
jgi:glycerophosphoryl diester phosphodiesterase